MSFQLVRASDDEIVVWHQDHGHIYVFRIEPGKRRLIPGPFKDIAEASLDATSFRDEALAFAANEARSRRLVD